MPNTDTPTDTGGGSTGWLWDLIIEILEIANPHR